MGNGNIILHVIFLMIQTHISRSNVETKLSTHCSMKLTRERIRLRELINEQREVEMKLRDLHKRRSVLNAQINELLEKHEPICASCSKHKLEENMHIATQEEVDEFEDNLDSSTLFSGPEVKNSIVDAGSKNK